MLRGRNAVSDCLTVLKVISVVDPGGPWSVPTGDPIKPAQAMICFELFVMWLTSSLSHIFGRHCQDIFKYGQLIFSPESGTKATAMVFEVDRPRVTSASPFHQSHSSIHVGRYN